MTVLAPLALALSIASNEPGNDVPLDQLEVMYWDCENSARDRMLSEGEAAACSETFERIKHQKFGGNFERFMQWWNANKQQERARRTKK